MSLQYPNPALRNPNSTNATNKVLANLDDLKPIIDEINSDIEEISDLDTRVTYLENNPPTPPDLTPFQPLVTFDIPPLVATNNAGTVDVNFTLLAENMVLVHEILYRGENDNNFTIAATLDYRSYFNHVYFANLGVVPVGATLIKIRTCFINGPIQESNTVTYNS